MRRLAIASLCLASIGACKRDRDAGRELVKANLVSEPGPLDNRVGAELGDQVRYLGNAVDSAAARPGGSFDVTHYWKVEAKPPAGSEVAVRLIGAGDQAVKLPASPMLEAHPPSAWKPGQIIRDRQRVGVPAGWKSPAVRLEVSAGGAVATVAEVPLEDGTYRVRRAPRAPEIDGKIEAAWKRAAWGRDFTVAKGGRPVPGSARAKLLWDREHLYALIEVVDSEVYSPFTGRDDSLWKADVVELFIDADKNRRGYVELQLNPRGAVFDAFFPVTRAQKHHFEWDSAMQTAVEVEGDPGDEGSRDRGWIAELAIPHRDVLGMAEDMEVQIPPQPGDSWRLNAVRVDKPSGGQLSASSWNPITIRDFHALGRMLTVEFAK